MVRVRDGVVCLCASSAILLGGESVGCGASSAPGDTANDASTSSSGGSGSGGSGGSSGSSGSSGAPGGGSASGGGSSSGGASSADAGDAPAGCKGLACQVSPGCTTKITGTVYDPAGANPLYHAFVFIPVDPSRLPGIPSGTSTCNTCDQPIGDYVTATTSAADGTFTLTGVPAGANIPIVVQIGKWRRMATIPAVTACGTTALPGSSMTRLPAKQSEGNIPQMAIVTGGADSLGCLLEDIGLDPGEFSAPHGGGRLDVYKGLPKDTLVAGALGGGGAPGLSSGGAAGDCTTDNPGCVWNSKANLEAYDIVLLACEADTFDPAESNMTVTNKTASAKTALHDWLDEGGRVFATHYQYTWFKNGPTDFQGVATWLGRSGGLDQATYAIDATFPKGVALSKWLGAVGASSQGQLALAKVGESVGAVTSPTKRWIYSAGADPDAGPPNDAKHLTFLTPVGGVAFLNDGGERIPEYCGKVAFTDVHAGDSSMGDIPAVCSGQRLTAQLEALEFLFFDLAACVVDESAPAPAPPRPAP
ncbi:MAG TPA: hypothetical protein VHV30_14550 [Polyangiaceae bacterium]|jgi:hypothetical protein|nr:hypothetical protein [Polyangiaceae bacterium]